MLDVELLLGRGGKPDARWRIFLAREVTPRFPDGLTVYDTYGQWRDPKRNVIVREQSRVLRIIVPADGTASDKIAAVAEAYKTQFRQKSVGIVTRPGLRVVLGQAELRLNRRSSPRKRGPSSLQSTGFPLSRE